MHTSGHAGQLGISVGLDGCLVIVLLRFHRIIITVFVILVIFLIFFVRWFLFLVSLFVVFLILFVRIGRLRVLELLQQLPQSLRPIILFTWQISGQIHKTMMSAANRLGNFKRLGITPSARVSQNISD